MISSLSAWRRLDHYLMRNHPLAWSLQLHGLHALVTAATAVLTLVTWLLPREILLEQFVSLRVMIICGALVVLFIYLAMRPRLNQTPPFTGSRWPRLLSPWYVMSVLCSPILFFSLMAQERIQPLARGYDLDALSSVSRFCEQNRSAQGISLKEECVEAVSMASGRPRAQINQDSADYALKLSDAVPDGLITRWSDFLLMLLSMSYGFQIFNFFDKDPITQKSVIGVFSLIFYLASLAYTGFIWFLYVLYLSGEFPNNPSAWRIVTAIVVALFFSVFYVNTYTGRRRTSILTICYGMVLVGFPALVFWIPLLISSPEQRMLHQAILLGCFLLLTPWIQRQHDRMRALPL
ncbi:MAG TPA: hypothetical protein VEU33_07500 [Archangium sp.]|nr:hypothetical protein [Archangium sp.]